MTETCFLYLKKENIIGRLEAIENNITKLLIKTGYHEFVLIFNNDSRVKTAMNDSLSLKLF